MLQIHVAQAWMSKAHVGEPGFALYVKMIRLKKVLPDALLKQVVVKRRGERLRVCGWESQAS